MTTALDQMQDYEDQVFEEKLAELDERLIAVKEIIVADKTNIWEAILKELDNSQTGIFVFP